MQIKRKKIQLAIFALALIVSSILAAAAPQPAVRQLTPANRIVSSTHLPEMCDTDVVGPNGLKTADQWALQQLEVSSRAPKTQMAAMLPQAQQTRPPAAPPAPTTNKALTPE